MSDEAKPGEGKTHFLKTWPQFFSAIADGSKPFEARKDDRDPPFAVGDELCLQEFVPGTGGGFTGKELDRKVTYILRGTEHVAPGYCILGLQSDQLADLTARLKQAEAERDALQSATGFDTYDQALSFVKEQRSMDDMVSKCCIPPQNAEQLAEQERRKDELRVLFGNAEAKEAHEEILRLRSSRDAAIAKLAAVERERSRMNHRIHGPDAMNDCPFCATYVSTGHAQQSPMCRLCQLESESETMRDKLTTLRTALEQYADPGNWHVGSKYDGESRRFTGPEEARKALDETEQVPNPETPPSKND